MEDILQLSNIQKRFGTVQALRDVNVNIARGEIVALIGDNGAGKSTLIKIISGYHAPSEGKMVFDGREVRLKSPSEARALGIETVYQDLALVENLSLWRNFFLGKERTGAGWMNVLRRREMEQACMQALADMGIRLRSTREEVGHMSGGERQAVAIARAAYFGAKLLILDEPTAALSVKETERVFEIVKEVSRKGVSVILIMHNLGQVYQVADRFVVLERGVQIGNFTRDQTTLDAITQMVVGVH
ncbi:ATP-binding cassette domain-containing protein [Alicyclobacillus shizuokensis]|uniref:ATP-binding cassette domain-containing protein n=1 Tax=Alicyclobacillus shizuokensis TaxID=392014 RepID=UPI00082CD9FA|nr:ATP-binding cassette domain-containing protein [Alicyclobacillus shizuokensis]MCL6626395.1 ATP-binding cassette domain-containing protein [Alicyclobacillus shizuokensis]